mmetsp:Transcript_8004/g.17264  ORF Transcript_8004/g.17264 Transcript_8004/m.17264 type:complete len:220 (+) Transcript_8004:226-885(+)
MGSTLPRTLPRWCPSASPRPWTGRQLGFKWRALRECYLTGISKATTLSRPWSACWLFRTSITRWSFCCGATSQCLRLCVPRCCSETSWARSGPRPWSCSRFSLSAISCVIWQRSYGLLIREQQRGRRCWLCAWTLPPCSRRSTTRRWLNRHLETLITGLQCSLSYALGSTPTLSAQQCPGCMGCSSTLRTWTRRALLGWSCAKRCAASWMPCPSCRCLR